MTNIIAKQLVCVLITFLLFPGNILMSQEKARSQPRFLKPIILFDSSVIGDKNYPISSKNQQAQAYFNQGMQLMYAFARYDAVRSFRQAWQEDNNCAICYWGEAWSLGSYLNGKITNREAPYAYTAIQTARKLKRYANKRERALIDALSVRYVKDFDPKKRTDQDTAYARAMEKVHLSFPDDLDITTLYADSLFLMQPRYGYRDLEDPAIQTIHGLLEAVLTKDIRHPGACHLYIHATESTTDPQLAEACAEFIGTSIPGASHINHMPSHTWNLLGRWADGVRANQMAWHSDLKAAFDQGVAIYPPHNLHMMLFAASMDGQGAVAIQAGKDFHKLTGNSMHHVLTLIRFGRFEEVLNVTDRPKQDIPGGIWDFAQGYAQLRTGNPDFAQVYLQRVQHTADTSKTKIRFHPAKTILGFLAAILEGEIHRNNGEMEAALSSLQRAVMIEDDIDYDEPEPIPFAARHWLGALLLELNRPAEAEAIYREELTSHPHNGWSLFGLKQALQAQGKEDPTVENDFEQSWARADHWIRASRF